MANIPKTHLFTEEDLRLFDLNQIYQISSIWYEKGMKAHIGTFDLFVRDLPLKRNFLLFGGLEEMTTAVLKWRYTKEEVEFLLDNQLITPKFAEYLKDFKFTGDIWAMPEGTAFFPNEPVLRITAPLIEANLFSTFLINALVSNTIFLSKFIRIVISAKGRTVLSSIIRAHSFESAMKSTRSEYISGVKVISSPAFYRKFNIKIEPKPPLATAYHAFIQSFPNELDAMRAAGAVFPSNVLTMIDTYNPHQGIENAIKLAKELQSKGGRLAGVIIDSGDLEKLSKLIRKRLDRAGLKAVQIVLASNLDEYKIHDLMKKNAPVDAFIAVTEAVTSSDAPKLEAVFKLAEVDDGKAIRPTIKLAKGKVSLPGKKQVFRKIGKYFQYDTIGLEGEKLGTPLLVPIITNGKLVYNLPSLQAIRAYVGKQITALPPVLKAINRRYKYTVKLSHKIQKQINILRGIQKHA